METRPNSGGPASSHGGAGCYGVTRATAPQCCPHVPPTGRRPGTPEPVQGCVLLGGPGLQPPGPWAHSPSPSSSRPWSARPSLLGRLSPARRDLSITRSLLSKDRSLGRAQATVRTRLQVEGGRGPDTRRQHSVTWPLPASGSPGRPRPRAHSLERVSVLLQEGGGCRRVAGDVLVGELHELVEEGGQVARGLPVVLQRDRRAMQSSEPDTPTQPPASQPHEGPWAPRPPGIRWRAPKGQRALSFMTSVQTEP